MLQFTLKSSILDRHRQLTLTPDYIEFDDRDLAGAAPTKFEKREIEGVRYGVTPVYGRIFSFGRIFCIDIRNFEGQIIRLRLHSIYGIRRKQLAEKYIKIAESLFSYYFTDIARLYIKKFLDLGMIEIIGVTFTIEGVTFDEKVGRIPWDYLGTRIYRTYYAIYSETEPEKYKAFDYKEQWNVVVLRMITESILTKKFPNRQERHSHQ